ncbi:MAG: hypothetical protein AB1711_06190 [Thermodesulfobacteriota bacterium]
MGAKEIKKPGTAEEQVLYASVLEKGMLLGLGILVITFIVYVLGILEPYVPVGELSRYWSMNVHDYLQAANIHPGWWWASQLGKGDFLNFIGIALLAGVTIICYAAIIPTLLRKKDIVYAVLALLEVIVLSAAASGLIAAGGH